MPRQIVNLIIELEQLKNDIGFIQKIDCTEKENKQFEQMIKHNQPLPNEIFQHKSFSGENINSFYRIYETDLSEEEKEEYIKLCKLKYLKTIKNGVVFFLIIAIVSITFTLINYLNF